MCRWWDCSQHQEQGCNNEEKVWLQCVAVVTLCCGDTASFCIFLSAVPLWLYTKCSRKPPLFDENVWLNSVVAEMQISPWRLILALNVVSFPQKKINVYCRYGQTLSYFLGRVHLQFLQMSSSCSCGGWMHLLLDVLEKSVWLWCNVSLTVDLNVCVSFKL